MSLRIVRICAVIIFLLIGYSKQYQIFYYFPAMFLSLEYLNYRKEYITEYNYKLLNTIFVSYVLFICIDRGRPIQFYPLIEIIINSVEHILFGFIICIKAAVYYSLFKKKLVLKKNELLLIAVAFNIFGFLNEFFQNWYKHLSLWHLNLDAQKDILMNITGSLLFVIFYSRINKHIQNQLPVK